MFTLNRHVTLLFHPPLRHKLRSLTHCETSQERWTLLVSGPAQLSHMQGYFVTVNELYSAQYPTKFWYVPLFLLLRDWVSVLFVVADFSEPILMCYPSKHVSGMFLYCWQCTWLCASVSSEARFLWRRTSNASLNINPVYPNPHLPPPLSSRRRRRHHPAVSP